MLTCSTGPVDLARQQRPHELDALGALRAHDAFCEPAELVTRSEQAQAHQPPRPSVCRCRQIRRARPQAPARAHPHRQPSRGERRRRRRLPKVRAGLSASLRERDGLTPPQRGCQALPEPLTARSEAHRHIDRLPEQTDWSQHADRAGHLATCTQGRRRRPQQGSHAGRSITADTHACPSRWLILRLGHDARVCLAILPQVCLHGIPSPPWPALTQAILQVF